MCVLCVCLSGCTDDIVSSDHSPVFGTFEVGVTSQFVSKKGEMWTDWCHDDVCVCVVWISNACVCVSAGLPKSSEQAYIEFENIEAIVKTASRTKFFIEFYSTCLEGKKHNSVFDEEDDDEPMTSLSLCVCRV